MFGIEAVAGETFIGKDGSDVAAKLNHGFVGRGSWRRGELGTERPKNCERAPGRVPLNEVFQFWRRCVGQCGACITG